MTANPGEQLYPHLFNPLTPGDVEIANRFVVTCLWEPKIQSEALLCLRFEPPGPNTHLAPTISLQIMETAIMFRENSSQ
jgi:hypothetical protein